MFKVAQVFQVRSIISLYWLKSFVRWKSKLTLLFMLMVQVQGIMTVIMSWVAKCFCYDPYL